MLTSRALVRDQSGIISERRDPRDLPHGCSVPFWAKGLPRTCNNFDAMPIRQYLDGERFDPETTRLLGIAFEFAIQALHNWGVDDPPREVIARAIIGFAKAGERDPERLCDLAVEACSKVIISDPNPLPPPIQWQ